MTLVILLLFCTSGELRAETREPAGRNDTLLMFLGEDLDVLSIASRRQESAWQAPAVAHVITREEMKEKGIRTVSHALEMEPGFYMAKKELGTQPYLRGIPNSVLFLYDTVPTGSDTSKSLHPLDHELSLNAIKRIEILRGPGSVLWGPDAFAGIVNLVPMTGKDLDGAETGILYGSPGNRQDFYANVGHDAGLWDAFLSVSGRRGEEDDTFYNVVRFWKDEKTAVVPEERYGRQTPEDSRYFNVSGRFSYGDWLTLSGLFSDYRKNYVMTRSEGDFSWREGRSAPFGLIKLEAKKNLDRSSALRFTGSYTSLNPEYEIIDKTLKQQERTAYGELIYDRSFLSGRGLFTGGLSYRNKEIDDAPIWNGYLPDYLGPENRNLVPGLTEKDYNAGLWSVFGQYNQKIGNVDLWLGLRNDAHDEYGDHLSYNLGAVWSPESRWMMKLLYGVAYRTPFARQLLEEGEPETEEIKTLNLQVGWKPSQQASLSVCGFVSRIERHIMEDPYAGLSLPNRQNIEGVEIEGRFSPVRNLDLSANLTLLDNDGPSETYHWNDYSFVRPDGTVVKHYTDLTYPYDSGADTLFNLTGTWRPVERVTAFLRLGYFSSRNLIFPRSAEICSVPGVWLVDMSATVRDIGIPGLDLELSVRNLLDRDYETPGTYGLIQGDPATVWVGLRKRW
ncbi:MAG: TonB-dependent receptor plug domain-containing protein [Deltaproteobacteria bacterium]|nr:TonB-dependent receptor plug domain-containing protein [Deltaproteobacteria bacterium]